jgi:hypothetical protein
MAKKSVLQAPSKLFIFCPKLLERDGMVVGKHGIQTFEIMIVVLLILLLLLSHKIHVH